MFANIKVPQTSEQISQTELPQISPQYIKKTNNSRAKSNRLSATIVESFIKKEYKSPTQLKDYLLVSTKQAEAEVNCKIKKPTCINFRLSRDISNLQIPISLQSERNWFPSKEEYIYQQRSVTHQLIG